MALAHPPRLIDGCGTWFSTDGHSPKRCDTASSFAGRYRQPSGLGDIDRGIDVPVENGSARTHQIPMSGRAAAQIGTYRRVIAPQQKMPGAWVEISTRAARTTTVATSRSGETR